MKYTKEQVKFQHPAKGKNQCGQCRHFLKNEEKCEIVNGKIQPEDWCNKFRRK
jgi:hypothetical protein